MLSYLMRGQAHREVFQLLWGRQAVGNVSALSRLAGISFSAVYRELESMREAGLASCERVGGELHYQAKVDHPRASLLRQLAGLPNEPVAGEAAVGESQASSDDAVRSWLASFGAPLGAPGAMATPAPELEEVLAEAVKLSHRDATVTRVLPVTLWKHRNNLKMARLVEKATRRDERQALGCFLELAGRLGQAPALVREARKLRDKRRSRTRMFFDARPRGRYSLALTRRKTPKAARRWGYLMNMDLDSFKSLFEKFAEAQ
jgi:hypothetical protein